MLIKEQKNVEIGLVFPIHLWMLPLKISDIDCKSWYNMSQNFYKRRKLGLFWFRTKGWLDPPQIEIPRTAAGTSVPVHYGIWSGEDNPSFWWLEAKIKKLHLESAHWCLSCGKRQLSTDIWQRTGANVEEQMGTGRRASGEDEWDGMVYLLRWEFGCLRGFLSIHHEGHKHIRL